MSFVNWMIDTFASDDIIDLLFILSDLKAINLSKAEWAHHRQLDAQSQAKIITGDGQSFDPTNRKHVAAYSKATGIPIGKLQF